MSSENLSAQCDIKLLAAAILLMTVQTIPARAEQIVKSAHFVVQYSSINMEAAQNLSDQAEAAFDAITSYLSRSYAKPIIIHISNDHIFPKFDKLNGRIVLPANRIWGNSEGPEDSRHRGPALVSNLTRVIAPSANPQWEQFLETGFRVFMHEKFSPNSDRSYPAMGKDLHKETSRLVKSYGKFIPLEEAEKARTWRNRPNRTRRLAYMEEGSFVRFLIEKSGLKMFLKLYDGDSFEKVYGVGIAALENDWKKNLKSIN